MKKILELLGSRKFWITVAAVIGGFATEGKAFMPKAVALVAAWIVAQGGTDVAKILGAAKQEPPK